MGAAPVDSGLDSGSPSTARHYGANASCPIMIAMPPDPREPPRRRKQLGQHFLTRPEVCRPLVEFLAPADRTVLEIGPGAGTLTRALLESGARVVAWELDLRWTFELRRALAGEACSLIAGDALELPWRRLPGAWLVSGNLPYNVATRIILDLVESTLEPAGAAVDSRRAGFLVQKEGAERLVAGPGSAAYGSLSVLVAAFAEVVRLGDVAPGAFSPPPKVDSSFVGLVSRSPVIGPAEYPRFKELVRAAFALRRKTLRNSLATVLGREAAAALVRAADLPPSARAEALGLDEFVGLSRLFTPPPG